VTDFLSQLINTSEGILAMRTAVPRGFLNGAFPRQLQRDLDHLFGGLLSAENASCAQNAWRAPASLWEDENSVYVELELPGVKAEQVDITIDGNQLRIKAERKAPEPQPKYSHQERVYGQLERAVVLPETANPDAVEATLTDGVLHVKIAKRPEATPKKIVVR
jgi:HSP20 family protein